MPADPGFVNAFQQGKQAEMFADQQGDEQPPGDGFGGEDDGFGGGPPGGPPGGGQPGGPPPFGQPPQDGATGKQDPLQSMMKGRRRAPLIVHVHDHD